MKKKIFIIGLVLTLIVSIVVSLLIKTNKISEKTLSNLDNETRRAMTYEEIKDSDDCSVENCENVKFSAFFTRDLNNDGDAEKYLGTCNQINKKATLYFDINVTQNGSLEDGKIEINGKNFDLQTLLVKDDVIKKDYIESNTTAIELNTIQHGTQKLFSGTIVADIGNNTKNYSVTDNTITLTGKWKPTDSSDGQEEKSISKTIKLTVDWYGKTVTEPYTITTRHDIDTILKDDSVVLNFDVRYREIAKELLIKESKVEIDIPDFNGVEATSATCTSQNVEQSYDNTNHKLTIQRKATENDSGVLTKTVSTDNTYNIDVKYPLEAYENIGGDTISLTFPTTGYYYGYNNTSEQFEGENPYESHASRAVTHTWAKPSTGTKYSATFDVNVGKYTYNPDTRSYRYIVSKELPLKIYNNIGLSEEEKDEYVVQWRAYTGNIYKNQNGIYLTETKEDQFKLADKLEEKSMKAYIKTKGIYFSNVSGLLADDGWIKVYNAENGDLLKEFKKSDWSTCTSTNPYYFESNVNSIKVVTSKANENSYLYVYQIKEIDDNELTKMEYSEFEKLNYIYSYLTGGLLSDTATEQKIDEKIKQEKEQEEQNAKDTDDSGIELRKDQDYANYEAPVSIASFSISPTAMTNQETKELDMTITTETTRYNEAKWKDGFFVIEMPEEILKVELENVTSTDNAVTITSSETYEENGKQYIKIYTSNEKETTYTIKIHSLVTADPRKATTNKSVTLHAINPNCHNYRETSREKDTLDIDKNKNTDEYILKKTASIQLIAPSSLLTSQTLSNFSDDNESVEDDNQVQEDDDNPIKTSNGEIVSPQVAILDKSNGSRDATVNIYLTNNYSETISNVVIVGKIPFKDNSYQLQNNKNLGSTFSVNMKKDGIQIPESLKSENIKVYYSNKDKVTKDFADPDNNWKTTSEIIDDGTDEQDDTEDGKFKWEDVKCYAIDLSGHTLQKKELIKFSYNIEIPAETKYNDISYSTHAIYFALDTQDGRVYTQTEVNRLGIMIAKKYNLKVQKTKVAHKDIKVESATYKVTDAETQETKTAITDEEGIAEIKDLYLDKTYILKEIKAPNSYILNEKEIKFKLVATDEEDSDGVKVEILANTEPVSQDENNIANMFGISADSINQNLENDAFASVQNENGKNVLTINAEDESKFDIKVVKKDTEVEGAEEQKLKDVRFRLIGGSYGDDKGRIFTTDENGEISIPNLVPGVEYTLQEVKATGYYINEKKIQFTVKRDNEGHLQVTTKTVLEKENSSESETTTSDKDTTAETEIDLDNGKLKVKVEEPESAEENGNEKGLVTFNITDEKIPTYKLKIVKKSNGKEENDKKPLKGTQFKLTSVDTGDVWYGTTNESGEIEFDGLYQFVKNKNVKGEYILKEVLATEGYITSPEEIKFKVGTKDNIDETKAEPQDGTVAVDDSAAQNENALKIDIIDYEEEQEEASIVTSTSADETTITLNIENKPIFKLIKKGETGEETEDVQDEDKGYKLLPGAKYKILNEDNDEPAKDINGEYIGEFVPDTTESDDELEVEGQTKKGDYILTTDENGEISANLPEGFYKIIEVEAPEGYDLPENEEDRTILVGIGKSKEEISEFKIEYGKTIKEKGHSNILDTVPTDDGGYITAGSFTGTISINGEEKTAKGEWDAIAIKCKKDGTAEWSYIYGTDNSEQFNAVAVANDGGYVLAGYETDTFEDGLLVKIDEKGNEKWRKTFTGEDEDRLKNVEVLQNGDIVTVGNFYSTSINLKGEYKSDTDDEVFVEDNTTTNEQATLTNKKECYADGFVACYDLGGKYKWAKGIQGQKSVNVTDVTETSQGIVIAADYLEKVDVIHAGTESETDANITNAGNQDSVLIGFNTEGTYEWNQKIGGTNDESIVELETDSEGNVIAVGGFASNLTLGKEDNTASITAPTTRHSNGLEVKYSSNGDYISSYYFGGTTSDEKIMSVVATKDGGVLLGGFYYSSNFDTNGDNENDITSNKGYSDGIIIKINSKDDVEWTRTVAGTSYDTVYEVGQLEDEGYLAVGNIDSDITLEDDSVTLTSEGYSSGFAIKLANVVVEPEIPEAQEIKAKNNLKQYTITTEIGENSDNQRKGGTITGQKEEDKNKDDNTKEGNTFFVESVKHGQNSKNEIVIKPDEDYSVYSIEINGEPYDFEEYENTLTEEEKQELEQKEPKEEIGKGEVRIPIFENVTQDYHIKVVFEKDLAEVIVHHYLRGRDGQDTTQSLAPDVHMRGKVGSNYTSYPVDIDGYNLAKKKTTENPEPDVGTDEETEDESEYDIPTNAYGQYEKDRVIEVNYYYEEAPLELTVHHYLEGTSDSLKPDKIEEKYKDDTYNVTPDSELLKRYVAKSVIVEPEDEEIVEEETNFNVSGTITQDTEVTYYYALKEFEITTEVVEHEETNILGVTSNVKGGTISGENKKPYEIVEYDKDSTQEIKAEADEDYLIKSIEVQYLDEEGNEIDEDNAEITRLELHEEDFVGEQTYTLENFTKVESDIHVKVEYEKKKGTVLVHHYIHETQQQVPSKVEGQEVVPDENKIGDIGAIYATQESPNVQENYEFVEVDGKQSGEYQKEEQIVTYYYKAKEAVIEEPTITKESNTELVKTESQAIDYKITYKATIKEFVGNATLTIVDHLPYKINQQESKHDGEYDDNAKTITWTIPYEDINTYEEEDGQKVIEITKNITLVYTGIDASKKTIENRVEGTLHLDDPETDNAVEAEKSIPAEFKRDIKVTKVWDDKGNEKGKRPQQITLVLKKNGTEAQTVDISSAQQEGEDTNKWSYTFTKLDRYDAEGNEITYTVEEREKSADELKFYTKGTATGSVDEGFTITNTINYAKVTVHHYIVDTATKVPSKLGNGEVVQDEIKEGNVGDHYDTQKSENVADNYEFVKTDGQVSGNMTETPIEVTYYYQLKDPTIESEITKDGTKKITEKDEKVSYTVNYTATIQDYIGDATLTIVDKLPYHIDEEASDKQEGVYDEVAKTLTWTEEIKGINSYTETNNEINRIKNLKLVFTDIDVDAESMTNEATGKIELKTPKKTDEKKDTEETEIDFKIDIPVEKVWSDNEDEHGKRPEEIELVLKANDQVDKTITISRKEHEDKKDANKWKYTFKDLPKYDDERNEITYTVEEKAKEKDDLKFYNSQISEENVENGVTITNIIDYGKVIVHHHIFGTDEKVPSKDGKVVEDELIEGNVGEEYHTKQSEEISPNYEYIVTEGNEEGEIAEDPTEVTYYYRLKDPKVTQTDVIKEAPSKITNKTEKVPYTIKYIAVVDEYIGDGRVTIVDKLPYHIDEESSELSGGTYNEKEKTITWTEEIKDINSFENQNNVISIQKDIEIIYTDIDILEEKMTNEVIGRLDLLKTDTHYEEEDEADTVIDVRGELTVRYKDKATDEEIEEPVTKDDKVGREFDVDPDKKEIPGYTLIEEPEEKTGKYTEEPQEKTYYYAKNTTVHVTYVDKLTKEEIEKDELIEGYEGKEYTTEQKEIENYKFVESTDNTKGKMTREQIEVIYYYIRPAKVVVRHVEKETEKDLIEPEEIQGYQDDEYTTEEKHLKFYNLVEKPENTEGNMTVTVEKDKDGKVTVNDTTYVIYYYEKKPFNLKLEKKIDSIILNGNTIKVDGDLGKAEVYRKAVNTSKIEVVYTLKVTNTGELAGKGTIRESIPSGMTMEKAKNTDWKINNNKATLETENINPGEAKEYKVRLTWKSSSANIGQKTNTAEIISTENEAGFEETIKVDNVGTADLIIAVGTGKEIANEMLIGTGSIAILLIGLIVLAKWQKKKEDK